MCSIYIIMTQFFLMTQFLQKIFTQQWQWFVEIIYSLYIPFLKKYWKAILKKMRSAIVFLTLLVFTPLEGKYIEISIQVWFYYVICIKFWMTQKFYIIMNFIGYSKLCHHCVLGHTNIIYVQKHIIFYIHNLRLFFSLCISFRERI